MRFLRFSLFLISTFLVLFPNIVSPAYSDVTVVYQNLTWAGQTCLGGGGTEVDQDDITGIPPTQIANIPYRPESTRICMSNQHGLNGTDYGFFIKVFQTIDYSTLSYVMTATPTGGNTSLFKVNGAQIGAIGYNTSFTHVDNNVYLAGLMNHASTTFDEGTSNSTVGSWDNLGVSSCTDFTTLQGDIFHEFVYQVKNDTTASFAFELFIDGNYWCTYLATTSQNPAQTQLGNTDDLGTGAGTGALRSRYREYEATPGRHLYSLQLAGANPDDPAGNNQQTLLVGSAVDSAGLFRNQYSLGETFILNGLLLNVTGPAVPISDALLEFSRLSIVLGQAITGSVGAANVSIFVAGSIGDSRTYQIDYSGSESRNLTSAVATVTIEIVDVGVSPGKIQTSLTIRLVDSNGLRRNDIIHGERIFFEASLIGADNILPGGKQIEFYINKNGSQSTLLFFTSAVTDNLGIAVSQPFSFGTDWIGASTFQARFLGDSVYIASNSPAQVFNVIQAASQLSIILELKPSTVNPQQIFETTTRLNINPEDGPDEPVIGELILIWWSTGGNWRLIQQGTTDEFGTFVKRFSAPVELGDFTLKSNATVNSVSLETVNSTLTVVAVIEIESDQLPDAVNLDDFLPDINDVSFGFSQEGNGILLWLVFFLLFGFGGIFAMNRTFPEAMSSQVVIAWFGMIFGASTGIGWGLGWLNLQFVLLLVTPIALLGGILVLKIFKGGNSV